MVRCGRIRRTDAASRSAIRRSGNRRNLAQIRDTPTVANGVVYIGSQTDQDSNDGKLNAFAAEGCGQSVARRCGKAMREANPFSNLRRRSRTDRLCRLVRRQALCVQCGWLRQSVVQAAVDGTDRWLRSNPRPRSTKAMVFVGSDDGKLYVFKAKGCRKATCKAAMDRRDRQRGFLVIAGDRERAGLYRRPARARGVRCERLRRQKLRPGLAGVRRKRVLQRFADGERWR